MWVAVSSTTSIPNILKNAQPLKMLPSCDANERVEEEEGGRLPRKEWQ